MNPLETPQKDPRNTNSGVITDRESLGSPIEEFSEPKQSPKGKIPVKPQGTPKAYKLSGLEATKGKNVPKNSNKKEKKFPEAINGSNSKSNTSNRKKGNLKPRTSLYNRDAQ